MVNSPKARERQPTAENDPLVAAREYVEGLEERLAAKELLHFWVMCDRKEFAPMKVKDRREMIQMLKDRASRYKNKRIAEISISPRPEAFQPGYQGFMEWVLSISVTVYKIYENGEIDKMRGDSRTGIINFSPEEVLLEKINMKFVETVMELVRDKKFVTDALVGVPYTRYREIRTKVGL